MKNLSELMKQATEMQAKMAEMQKSLDALEIEGEAGGGMVRVTLTGKGMLKSVRIDPSLGGDDLEIIEDLIVAAHNDAKIKSEDRVQEEMKKVTGGLQLPPGFKLPI